VPAKVAFSLELVNRDNAPHNISIYRDATAADKLFGGDIVSGPANRVYSVPALPPGTWYFRCDVHPDMHGTIIAAP
jgi:plastocyanin